DFIAAIVALAVAAVGGALGNMASSQWERARQVQASADRFRALYEAEQYASAYNVGLSIAADRTQGSEELARWLNNTACAAVWAGMFQDAAALLELAGRAKSGTWWHAIIVGNLAYVRYHLGGDVQKYLPNLERAIPLLAAARNDDSGW